MIDALWLLSCSSYEACNMADNTSDINTGVAEPGFPTKAQIEHFNQCLISATEICEYLKDDLETHSPGDIHLFAYKILNGNPEEDAKKRYKSGVRLDPSRNILLSRIEVTTTMKLNDGQLIRNEDFHSHFTHHPERGYQWWLEAGTKEIEPDEARSEIEQAEVARVQFDSPQKPVGNWPGL